MNKLRRHIRIAVVLTCTWVIGLVLYVAVDWLHILPGHCQLDPENLSRLVPIDRVFFHCDPYSDMPTSWWGESALRVRDQVIAVRIWLLVAALLAPLLAIWLFVVILPKVWSWALQGEPERPSTTTSDKKTEATDAELPIQPHTKAPGPSVGFGTIKVSGILTMIVVLGVAGFLGNVFAKKTIHGLYAGTNEALLSRAAEEVNKIVPKMIDSETRLDKALAGPGLRFTYEHTFVHYPAAAQNLFDTYDRSESFSAELTQKVCGSTELRPMLSLGTTIVYVYKNKNGQKLFDVAIATDKCSFK